jgi:hypothetical protein
LFTTSKPALERGTPNGRRIRLAAGTVSDTLLARKPHAHHC